MTEDSLKLLEMLLLLIPIVENKPILIGHRGSDIGIENTKEAFIGGVEKYGYSGLECDVHVTKDNHYVINHDGIIKGAKGKMVITESTLEELKSNELTKIKNKKIYKANICTLEEYLKICKEKKVFPVIELKKTKGINPNDMSKFAGVVELVKKYKLENETIFISFYTKVLEHIINNYPNFKVHYLIYCINPFNYFWIKKWKVTPSCIFYTRFSLYFVKKLGLKTAVWVINTRRQYLKYFKLGIDYMTCDYLDTKEVEEIDNVSLEKNNDL